MDAVPAALSEPQSKNAPAIYHSPTFRCNAARVYRRRPGAARKHTLLLKDQGQPGPEVHVLLPVKLAPLLPATLKEHTPVPLSPPCCGRQHHHTATQRNATLASVFLSSSFLHDPADYPWFRDCESDTGCRHVLVPVGNALTTWNMKREGSWAESRFLSPLAETTRSGIQRVGCHGLEVGGGARGAF